MPRTRVGVLASGRGTDFQSLVDARERRELDVELAVLISNVPDALVLDRAKRAHVPGVVVDHRQFGEDREGFERAVVKVLREHRVDLVVFAGFMRIVTAYLVSEFPNRIMNIHPSLLPAFPGAHAHRDVLAAGAKVSGCTIHFVDASVDGGPFILQKAVPVREDDTEESLEARVLEWEHRLLPLAVQLFAEGRLRVEGRRVRIDTRGIDVPSSA
jgi:phosphoribosylglycinamide formyltransferase-1